MYIYAAMLCRKVLQKTTYTGLIKRETTKAVQAVINFVVVFILSASFIAYAPDYITKINDFSTDISPASLDVGTKIVLPNTNSQGKDSVDMIRDSLFSVQVKQPWLLLQYGTTDVDSLGTDRVESLLSTSPDTNNGEDRENIVIDEIEDHENTNLTIPKTISRLGTVFFLFFFNIGISVFIFLLTGIMIFSQVLFIIFAMFLPISFLLSMIPSFNGMGKKAVMKLFNVIMTRAGITLIITVAFSISTMLYSLSANSPFFMIMFLQIVTFAGIYFKLGDLMSMFSLQSNDSQNVSRQIFRKPRMLMNRQARKLQRNVARAVGKDKTTNKPKEPIANGTKDKHERQNENPTNQTKSQQIKRPSNTQTNEKDVNMENRQNTNVPKNSNVKDKSKKATANTKQAVYKGERELNRSFNTFQQPVGSTKNKSPKESNQRKTNIAQKRLEIDKVRREHSIVEPTSSMPTQKTREILQSPKVKRPTTPKYVTPELSSKEKKRDTISKIKNTTPMKKDKGRKS